MNEIVLDDESWTQMMEDRPGDLLRAAREQRGMTIAEVAEVTRVAQRQLEAIERSDFSALPGTPYAVGFARAYARAVGADEVEVARGVRAELGAADPADRYEMFEPVDPARIPPRRLAWVAAILAILLGTAYAVWRTQFFSASTDQEISDLSNRVAVHPAVQKLPVPTSLSTQSASNGPVVITAVQDVWLRIYDAQGTRLLEKQMVKGESYTVPEQADNPMILTGRPNALAVTVGGEPVAPLGPPEKTISDIPISATALLVRPAVQKPAPAAISPAAATASGTPALPQTQARKPVALSPSTLKAMDEAAITAQPSDQSAPGQ